MNWIFNQIVSLLGKIGRDKLYHLMVGLIIGSFCTITLELGDWSLAIVAVIAIMKELFDKIRGSESDPIDFAYTLIGGVIITFFYILGVLL